MERITAVTNNSFMSLICWWKKKISVIQKACCCEGALPQFLFLSELWTLIKFSPVFPENCCRAATRTGRHAESLLDTQSFPSSFGVESCLVFQFLVCLSPFIYVVKPVHLALHGCCFIYVRICIVCSVCVERRLPWETLPTEIIRQRHT